MSWCTACHYGSEACKGRKCPLCGYEMNLDSNPFPEKPQAKGSGKDNGKTERDHKHE